MVSVCGLSERKLPSDACPSGVLILKVDGMSVGGSEAGTIIFVRNDHDKQTDTVRFRVHRDEIFLPFVNKQRMDCDGWTEGCTIDDSMQVISWCDGDLQQIATVGNTKHRLNPMKIKSRMTHRY